MTLILTGNGRRDADRSRRARALLAAHRRTGDRRKLKRAKRLQRQVWTSTMRRISEAMRGVSAAFLAGASVLGSNVAAHLHRIRLADDARLAREANAIGLMMKDHPDLSAADAQRIYRAGGEQLMTRPVRADELPSVIFDSPPCAMIVRSPVRAGKTLAMEKTIAEARARGQHVVTVRNVDTRVRKQSFIGPDIDYDDPVVIAVQKRIRERIKAQFDEQVLRMIAPPRNPR